MADEVRIAADRRGEVAVVRRGQAGVAEVGVVGACLSERSTSVLRPIAPVAGATHVVGDERGDLPRRSAACCGVMCSGSGGVGDVERGELRDEPLDRSRVGPLVDAVERRLLALGQQPATCSLARIIRCSIRRWDSVCTVAMAPSRGRLVELELRLGRLDGERAAALAPASQRRGAPRARPRAARPRAPAPAPRRRRCGRPGRSQARVGADQRAVEGDRCERRAPRRSISTVTARRSSPGTSEQAPLESASGSIGSTAPGT